MPDIEHQILVIDNSLPSGHASTLAGGAELIGSDNIAWEFSAWDEGIAHCGARLEQFDFVNLVTSAFKALNHTFLEYFTSRLLDIARGRAMAIGHIDYFNSEVVCFGAPSQAWLRSSFIVIPPSQLRQLKPITTVVDRSAIFSGDPSMPFRDDAPLSAEFRRYIVDWLTGGGTGQGVQWHSRFTLDADTLKLFEEKVLAIVNEHMLTQRAHALGCEIVDATWLARHIRLSAQDDHPIAVPTWQEQVASRNRRPAWPRRLLASVRISDLWR